MKIEEANKIIHEYGIILEIGSSTFFSTVMPETFLPYSIKEIKKAIKLALFFEKDTKQITALTCSFIRLADFIPLEEALIIFQFEKWIHEWYSTEKVSPNEALDIKSHPLRKKSVEIFKKVAKKMEELINEIN